MTDNIEQRFRDGELSAIAHLRKRELRDYAQDLFRSRAVFYQERDEANRLLTEARAKLDQQPLVVMADAELEELKQLREEVKTLKARLSMTAEEAATNMRRQLDRILQDESFPPLDYASREQIELIFTERFAAIGLRRRAVDINAPYDDPRQGLPTKDVGIGAKRSNKKAKKRP